MPGYRAVWLCVLAVAVAAGPTVALDSCGGGGTPPKQAAPVAAPTWRAGTGPAGVTSSTCPTGSLVRDAQSLTGALAAARPGTVIRLADGVYTGHFVASVPGTAARPIYLCGGTGAVLDGGGQRNGYGLHLDGASYWHLIGFGVRNAQKGVVLDHTQFAVLDGLTVSGIGDEGIHLRSFSSDNTVTGNALSDIGVRKPQYGEGIYIGSAQSNWCQLTGCKPDQSDRNTVRGNRISATAAESVDIKEGTAGGSVVGNTFDGSAMRGNFADSWVDVKGNGWLIQGNVGRNSRQDGFQQHQILRGWGTGNVFAGNTAVVNGPGWGFHLQTPAGNTVRCDNKVSGAASGLANSSCS